MNLLSISKKLVLIFCENQLIILYVYDIVDLEKIMEEKNMATLKAGTILVNLENKKIGLIYRKDKIGYEFPKGHLEEGETLEECAIRETEEETGRKNHIVGELETVNYVTSKGEDVELHFYLAIDDGETDRNIAEEDKEEIKWFYIEEVVEKLTFKNTIRVWNNSKEKVLKLLNTK